LQSLSPSQRTQVLADLQFATAEEAAMNGFDEEQLILYANDVLHLY